LVAFTPLGVKVNAREPKWISQSFLTLLPLTPSKMSFSLSHPVNTALLLYILYLLQRIIVPSTSTPRTPPTEFKAGYSWMPRTHAPSVLFTTYTPRTLEKFSGKDGGRILLAIDGTVFDVTAGRGFYGPGEHSLPFPFPIKKAD
jgi:membrane-associated progesterone receptor component